MSDKPEFVPTPGDFFGWMSRMMSIPAQAVSEAMPKSLPNVSDPLEMWKTLQERNEKMWASVLRQITASPEFAQTLGRASGASTLYRTNLKKAARAYLEAANMPSRDDLTHLARQIVRLDAKVDDLEEALADVPQLVEQADGRLTALAGRLDELEQRLKPSERLQSLPERLDRLENQLDRLESALSKVVAALEPDAARPDRPAAEESGGGQAEAQTGDREQAAARPRRRSRSRQPAPKS